MKRNLSLQNWTKRVFPLYKNLIGITEDGRIIGIDPDMYTYISINCWSNH
jgi:hypothetical protein